MFTKTASEDERTFLQQVNNLVTSLCDYYTRNNHHVHSFSVRHNLEPIFRLFYVLDEINSEDEKIATFVDLMYADNAWINRDNKDVAIGWTLLIKPRTKILPSSAKPMPVVAEQLEHLNKKNFIQVFTCNNILFCASNTPLNLKSYVFLKILQYNLFKDNFKSFSQDTLDLLQGIFEDDLDKINKAIANIKDLKKLKKKALRKEKLEHYLQPDMISTIRQLEESIVEIQQRLATYRERYLKKSKELEDTQQELELLKRVEFDKPNIDDFINHIVNHPYIVNVNLADGYLYMTYQAPIRFWDPYKLEDQRFGRNNTECQILDIFKTEKYRLWTSCRLRFDLKTFDVVSVPIDRQNIQYKEHPHIARYGCFGTHLDEALAYRKRNDHIGMIDQITEAVTELNFGDGTVVTSMLNDLEYNKYLETWEKISTGEILSTKQVLEDINNGKTENE